MEVLSLCIITNYRIGTSNRGKFMMSEAPGPGSYDDKFTTVVIYMNIIIEKVVPKVPIRFETNQPRGEVGHHTYY
jgi:hypothetical protein